MSKFRPELECYGILMRDYEGRVGTEECDCEFYLAIPKKRRVLRCTECGRDYDPRIGTPFDRSNIDLAVWFYAVDRWNEDMDYTAYQLANETGIMYATAQRVMGRVSKYIWNENYRATACCEVVVKKERRARPLGKEEFIRPLRKYRRKG